MKQKCLEVSSGRTNEYKKRRDNSPLLFLHVLGNDLMEKIILKNLFHLLEKSHTLMIESNLRLFIILSL